VRSHECVPEGVLEQHGGRLLTVFSASNYCGTQVGAWVGARVSARARCVWVGGRMAHSHYATVSVAAASQAK
jgi:hypothetical protein